MNTCYCDKPTLYLRKQGLNSRAFANLWVFFIFFADWLVNIPDASSTIQTRLLFKEQNRCSVFLTTEFRVQVKIQNAPKKLLFRDFCKFNLC